jgi:hypothetical protein
MFDRQGNAVGSALVSIPKTNLLANTPTVTGLTYLGPFNYTTRGSILQPAITTGLPTTPELFVAAGDLGLDQSTGEPDGPQTTVILSTLLNRAIPSLSAQPVVLTVPSYTVPIDPAQPNGRTPLADNDARLSASVRRVGDLVYATQAIEQNNRAAVRWYRMNAANNTLLQSGTISDTTLDLFYPSIAANESGGVVIGCNGSSSSTFISSYAVAGSTTNGTLSFGALTLLKAGTATYRNPDPTTGESRWGDYSATTVDPADPTRFWTIQMIAVGRTAWATQITELITSGGGNLTPPDLAIMREGNDLVVSWAAVTNSLYQLQSSSSLEVSTNWLDVSQSPILTNGVNEVVLPESSALQFFRLVGRTQP